MLTKLIKDLSVEEVKSRMYLTEHESNMLVYLKSGSRSKDKDSVCRMLGMSKQRFIKTKRSLTAKLSRIGGDVEK